MFIVRFIYAVCTSSLKSFATITNAFISLAENTCDITDKLARFACVVSNNLMDDAHTASFTPGVSGYNYTIFLHFLHYNLLKLIILCYHFIKTGKWHARHKILRKYMIQGW